VLLFDVGGVCLYTPFELHHHLESKLGWDPGTITWMSPFDPSTDELWAELFGHGEELNEREYWHRRSALVGANLISVHMSERSISFRLRRKGCCSSMISHSTSRALRQLVLTPSGST
jgi:hypothetical protein